MSRPRKGVDPQAARVLAVRVIRDVWLAYWQHKAMGFRLRPEHVEHVPNNKRSRDLHDFILHAVDDGYLDGADFAFWCELAGLSVERAAKFIRATRPASGEQERRTATLEKMARRYLPGLLEGSEAWV